MAALGTVAVMCQALLLREAMTTLGGSEIAWGLLLFLWLIGAAGGARIGGTKGRESAKDRWTPLAVAVSTVSGSALLRAAPWLLVDVGGEVASAPVVFLLWVVAVVPPAMAVGFAFARFAGALGNASPAYAFECAGAALGGFAFTFVLAPFGSPVIAGAALGIAFITGFLPKSRMASVVSLALCCTIGFAAGPWVDAATWAAGRRAAPLAQAVETRHQRIEIGAPPNSALYIDGRLVGILPADPYLVLPKIRLLALLHPEPAHTVVIGGLADGRIVGLLDPSVHRLTVVEEDIGLVEALRAEEAHQIDAFLNDPRVEISHSDPIRAMRRFKNLDMVVLLDGPPITLRANRSRTLEFFELCRASLRPNGVLVVDGSARGDYLGGAAGRLLGIQFTTLTTVFPKTSVIDGDPTYLVGGMGEADLDMSTRTLEQRWKARTNRAGDTLGVLLPTLLQPRRSAELTTQLREAKPQLCNRVNRPELVLPAAAFSEARGFHPLFRGLEVVTAESRWVAAVPLAAVGAWLLFAPLFGTRNRIRSTPAVVLGFASMTWWLLLMGVWQGTRGSVYSEVGLLTALFMAGTAAGSVATMKAPTAFGATRFFVAGAVLSAAIAAGLANLWPTGSIPMLLICGGLITGAAFPGVAALAGGRRSRGGIIRAFAGDELGGAAAALLVGVIGIPWLGTTVIAAVTASFCLAVIPGTIGNRSS